MGIQAFGQGLAICVNAVAEIIASVRVGRCRALLLAFLDGIVRHDLVALGDGQENDEHGSGYACEETPWEIAGALLLIGKEGLGCSVVEGQGVF